jgi:Ras-related protein Rab-8A
MYDEEEAEDDYNLYKILVLGDTSVGKSCLLLRFCDNSFQEAHLTTIGLDFRLKTINLKDDRKVKIQIWDTAGEDRFRSITRNYYKGAKGILLIFDVTDKETFTHVRDWIERIHEESPEGITICLVGNKIDMNESRVISNEEGKKIADEFKIPYFETSAKSNIGVEEVFTYLVKEVDTIYMNEHKEEVGRKTVLNQKTKNKKKKCC